jgi:hypothetical protein
LFFHYRYQLRECPLKPMRLLKRQQERRRTFAVAFERQRNQVTSENRDADAPVSIAPPRANIHLMFY